MNTIAIIGGSALPKLEGFKELSRESIETPYGAPSSSILMGKFADKTIYFLDRHGSQRCTPPHKINYRANFWALHQLGVKNILGTSIVGGIRSDMAPGHFVFPDQLIDYTVSRPSSFYEDDFDFNRHIDFTYPYCSVLHGHLVNAAEQLGLYFSDDATYGVTQGPRFETVAEVNRLEKDGCDVVGMTAMPEAVLARELNIAYATIAIVGTKAAGRSDGLHVSIDEITSVVEASMEQMYRLLTLLLKQLP